MSHAYRYPPRATRRGSRLLRFHDRHVSVPSPLDPRVNPDPAGGSCPSRVRVKLTRKAQWLADWHRIRYWGIACRSAGRLLPQALRRPRIRLLHGGGLRLRPPAAHVLAHVLPAIGRPMAASRAGRRLLRLGRCLHGLGCLDRLCWLVCPDVRLSRPMNVTAYLALRCLACKQFTLSR